MKKILVNATANDARGPLSLTKSFLKDLVEHEKQLESENIFITTLVSNKELLKYNSKHIEVIYDVKPKVSFLAKLSYEYRFLPALMKEKNYRAYLSLQNTAIKKGPWKQFVLIHTPLPFVKISLADLEKKNFIKYKILLRNVIARQIEHTNEIIVQTKWMKDSIRKLGFKNHITIHRPSSGNFREYCNPLTPSIEAKITNVANKNKIKLLYPTNLEKYKNNNRLISAVKRYNEKNEHNQVVLYLTLDGQDDTDINYLGKIPFESMYTLYKKMDALIFPSIVETLGLPLLEAEESGLNRIVADREYAREICKNNAYYFDPYSIGSIMQTIEQFVFEYDAKKENREDTTFPIHINDSASYYDYIKIIQNTW
ncbi:glycosyltransferase [Niallia sp. 01092]|uniref:glycosyltransferase n=1 Tax=unclassified Niallia TaxID=2837522 RepID=UPI003FD3C0BF